VLVEERSLRARYVRDWFAESDQRSETGGITYLGPQVGRPGRPEPFELQI
tara:strand:+ start:1386 stop:1535 length:150 start_codon:yes stop_codon:yes gene_type:complete